MKENSLIFENNQTGNNSEKENQSENKINIQTEPNYLHIFCKEISKINHRDECGWTPLYRTVVSGILPATELLLNNGADPNIQSSMGETPLYQAVEMEKISHVNLLLQKGADPNISQIDGLSPLHSAVNKQNILIIKELLKYKANPNNKSKLYEQTPLHFAIKNNVDPMILLILVQYNGDLFIKDKFGKRPLDYVCSEEMKKVIEKLKLENEEFTPEKKVKQFNTPNKEIKWSESKILSDSLDMDSFDKENKIIFGNNIVLKEPGNNYHHYYRVKSGNLGNVGNDSFNNIRKLLFKKKYNKKIINKSFSSNYTNSNINSFGVDKVNKDNLNNKTKRNTAIKVKYNHVNKDLFNKIKKNLAKINYSNQKIPNNFYTSSKKVLDRYSTMQFDDEKSVISQKAYYAEYKNKENNNLNIPISKTNKYPNSIKNKGTYISNDKENKSTCLNSETSTNSKNEKNLRKNSNDYSTISEVKKFTLIPRDSRNNKLLSHYISLNKINNHSNKSTLDYKKKNFNSIDLDIDKNINSIQINDYYNDNSNNNKLYTKPKVSMNEISNNSGYTFNIINNNTVNNKNFFNNSNRTPKTTNSTEKNLNLSNNYDIKKGPLKVKKFKLQKKVLNVKNFAIPFDRKKVPYIKRNTCNSINSNANNYSNSNIYNTINSSNNDSFWDTCSQMHINKKNSNTSSSIYDSIIIELEKYPIYDWLNEINLSCYTNLFLQKKIFDLNKIIEKMKRGKIKMTPKDIYKLGIKIPGHIYRIFVKLEIDSGIIDSKIVEIIENKKYDIKNEEINILNNSIYNLCGCCSLKERSRSTCKKNKNKVYEIEQWLININMLKYKNNFIENGFDKFEYFFLQMFGSFPIDSNILKNSIGIINEKDRDLILLQLQKDVKYLSLKSKNIRNYSNPKIFRVFEQNLISHEKSDSQECKIY